jgi:hypothetical protein
MLKRSLCVVALVLMGGAGYARDYVTPAGGTISATSGTTLGTATDGSSAEIKGESYNWPTTYTAQDVCVIPVTMDVGFWIKVNNAKDLTLKLKQVEIHKYTGTADVSLNCNVSIKLSVVWTKDASVNLGSYSSSASVSPATLDAPGGTATISLTLSNVDLSNLTGGTNCLQVGTVTLKVTPNVTPQLAGGCS